VPARPWPRTSGERQSDPIGRYRAFMPSAFVGPRPISIATRLKVMPRILRQRVQANRLLIAVWIGGATVLLGLAIIGAPRQTTAMAFFIVAGCDFAARAIRRARRPGGFTSNMGWLRFGPRLAGVLVAIMIAVTVQEVFGNAGPQGGNTVKVAGILIGSAIGWATNRLIRGLG
jgi:hypothetical protein